MVYRPRKGEDGEKRRARETRFVWDGMRMIAEEGKDGETKARTVWGRGWEVLKRTDLTRGGDEGHDIFYHEDGKGWIAAVSGGKGHGREWYRYSAYGKVTFVDKDGEVRDRQTVPNPWLYHGYFRDEETGHYYTVHRYLDPEQGRWLSRDPLGYHDGMGLYEFAGANPVVSSDYLGTQKTVSGTVTGVPYTGAQKPDCPSATITYRVPADRKWVGAIGNPAVSCWQAGVSPMGLALCKCLGVGFYTLEVDALVSCPGVWIKPRVGKVRFRLKIRVDSPFFPCHVALMESVFTGVLVIAVPINVGDLKEGLDYFSGKRTYTPPRKEFTTSTGSEASGP